MEEDGEGDRRGGDIERLLLLLLLRLRLGVRPLGSDTLSYYYQLSCVPIREYENPFQDLLT